MVKSLTPITTLHKNPFIWLFELRTRDEPARRFRLTNFTDLVEFGVDPLGAPLVYYPAPIVHSGVIQDAQSGLPSIDVTIGANTPEANELISVLVDVNEGYVGSPVRIIVVSALELGNPDAGVTDIAEVVGCTMKNEAVGFTVSSASIFQRRFPPGTYSKTRCKEIFGNEGCGYNINAPGAGFTTCANNLSDCTERGDDEEANPAVAARQHPDRFGAKPAIPRLRKT